MMWRTEWLGIGLGVLLAGCAGDLSDRLDPNEGANDGQSLVVQLDASEGQGRMIDATLADRWVHLRLDDGSAYAADALQADAGDWDLAFQRFKVRVNGGVSGVGGVEVAVLTEPTFEEVQTAPADGYLSDAPDADGDGEIEPVFESVAEGWYVYDSGTHTLSPRALVYVVQTHDGRFEKLEFLDYYDEAGSSGFPQIVHAEIETPEVQP